MNSAIVKTQSSCHLWDTHDDLRYRGGFRSGALWASRHQHQPYCRDCDAIVNVTWIIFRIKHIVIQPSTHWGRVTHICVVKLTIIGSDNGLSPGRRQAIIWTNAGILLIGPLGTNFTEILIGIQTFSFKKMHLKMSSAKWRPFSLGLNVLIRRYF